MEGDDGLLFYGLDRYGREVALPPRFEHRLRVGPIGLVAVTVTGDVTGMEQRHPVAEPLAFPSPVMGRAAGLEHHLDGRLLDEEWQAGGARQPAAGADLAGDRRESAFEDGLGEIDTDL